MHASDTEHAPGTFSISIGRQPLDEALQQLAHQCDVQVIFFSRVTEGLSAPTVEGNYTVAAAMDRLLAGSGLTSQIIDPQTIEVRPTQARVSDRAQPRAAVAASRTPAKAPNAAAASEAEVVIVGLAEQLVATRVPTPLREIPQTLSIVTGEQMRQRNDVTLEDVLEHAPGITTARTSSIDQDFYARSYRITAFHIDGGPAVTPKSVTDALANSVLYFGLPDLMEFDHVEILRGADGLFSGNANPGGTIGLVRKRPQRNFALAFSAAGGSWGTRREELDITGPIALDGALRGRAAAVDARDGYFYNIDPHDRKKVFGAIEYDFTPTVTLTVGGSYQWDTARGVGSGLPFYGNGRDSRLPRSSSLDFDWTRYRSEMSDIYVQYRQELSSAWALSVGASRWRTDAQYAIPTVQGVIDPATNEMSELPWAIFTTTPTLHTQETADVTLTGRLNWFGWREELAAGADFTRSKSTSDSNNYVGFGELRADPRTFDPRDYPDPRPANPLGFGLSGRATGDRWGLFSSLRVDFDEAWSIIGGARLSGDTTDTRIALWNTLFPDPIVIAGRWGTNHVVTPYAGLMYAFDKHYSLYASYADIYLSQDKILLRESGSVLGPIRGFNIEAGIKGEWRGGALNGSLAVYQTQQSNLPEFLPGSQIDHCCYTAISNKSRGVDAELSGEVTSGWDIGAGYTYNISEFPPSNSPNAVTPKHLLKAWTDIRLPGAFSRAHIGGSVHAQSETISRYAQCYFPGCWAGDGIQRAYAVFDLRAALDVDRHWRVALSLNNAFDKVYYETIDPNSLHAWYGAPRNWMLRIDGRY